MPTPSDKIFISGMECMAHIGVPAEERATKQLLSIDLEFPADCRRAAASDNIEDAVDYGDVAKCVAQVCASREFQLVETLAEQIAGRVLASFPISELRLVVRKIAPVPSPRVAHVSVTIVRSRSSL